MKPIIGITAGDINGIGYEVILKTLSEPHLKEICTPIVYGNAKVATLHAKTLQEELHSFTFHLIQDPKEAKDGVANLITCYANETPVSLGTSTPEAGKAAFQALDRACKDLKAGKIAALVTAPINKDNIQSEAFSFTGHTEYLTSLFAEKDETGAPLQEALMMMTSDLMRIALVCNHTPIAKVSSMISEERILRKLTTLNKSLQQDFTIRMPRIAVLALNPHAGDNGLIGNEEQEIIVPAIKKANEQGIYAFGPYSADGFFGAGQYTHFDVVLAMYHDQGLIPFKSLDMSGVNYTAGLPVIRTSPDHGTAYDIAGKNMADPTSMRHAVYTAIDVLKARALDKEINADPLPIPERPKEDKRPHIPFFVPTDKVDKAEKTDKTE